MSSKDDTRNAILNIHPEVSPALGKGQKIGHLCYLECIKDGLIKINSI